jgi:quercetin dioxygenase-like cupin family protein
MDGFTVKHLPEWLALAGMLVVAPAAAAHGATAGDGEERVTVLQQHKVPASARRKILFFTVDYAPGQQSIPHVHGGAVIAYVLEGAVVSQLEGEAPVTYRAGQSWYEAPRVGHLVSRNASATRPARLLVWILGDEGAPVLTPLGQRAPVHHPKRPWSPSK